MNIEERVAVLEATVQNGHTSRIERIENRQWAIMCTTILTLIGVIIQLVI